MEKRMIVLVPLPLQGHLTPLIQLGRVLNSKGFSITVALPQGDFNQVSSSQHFPGFQFVTIQETIPLSQHDKLGVVEFIKKLNKTSEASFKDCIAQLLLQQGGNVTIACIIYDELLYFSEAVAKEFKLPSFIFSTGSATNQVCSCVLIKLNAEKLTDLEMQDMVVENLHPLRYKDLPVSGMGPLDRFLEICKEVVDKRTASGLIINTTSCLESLSLSWLQQEELEAPHTTHWMSLSSI